MKTITTERLLLRSIKLNDLEDFFECWKNPNVGPKAGWEPITDKNCLKEILQKLIDDDQDWAVVYKDSNKVIGSIGLHPDRKRGDVNARMLIYDLSEEFWNKGLMTEAVKRVIQFAFEEMKLDVLSVYHYPFIKHQKELSKKAALFMKACYVM